MVRSARTAPASDCGGARNRASSLTRRITWDKVDTAIDRGTHRPAGRDHLRGRARCRKWELEGVQEEVEVGRGSGGLRLGFD